MNSPARLLLLLPLLLIGCSSYNGPTEEEFIEVSGQGEVQGTPDIFSVRAVARREGQDIARLKDQVNAEVDTMLALAAELGIAENNITAATLRVSPRWQYQPSRKLLGYQVERPVDIEVSGIATYARLVTGLADAGVTEIQAGGASLSNAAELEHQALEAAMQEARKRAEVLARAGERDLGDVIRVVSQSASSPSPRRMEMMASANDSGTWNPGEHSIRQQVTVRFRLQ